MRSEFAVAALSFRRRRVLAVAAGLVAVSAYAGGLGLATGSDPYVRHLIDQLPLRSPALAGASLVTVVAVPYTILARDAWRGDPRIDARAVVAGSMLTGWIALEVAVLTERSFLELLYAAIGVLTMLTGRRALPRCSVPRRPSQGTG